MPLVLNNAKERNGRNENAFPKLVIFESQYRRIRNNKSVGTSRNRRRKFKNFHKTKSLQSNQSQDIGLRAISKVFNP